MFGRGSSDDLKAAKAKRAEIAKAARVEQEELMKAANEKNAEKWKAIAVLEETKKLGKERAEFEECRIALADGSSVFVISIVSLPSLHGPGPAVKAKIEKILLSYPGHEVVDIDLHFSPERSLSAGHILTSIRVRRVQTP